MMRYVEAATAWHIAADQAQPYWGHLPFFVQGHARHICQQLDARVQSGEIILPAPSQLFMAFKLTPLSEVKVVILGQDPYPTVGDAHGLAFSYQGEKRIPASLRNIYKELSDDIELKCAPNGNLSAWAHQGVLLLNTALSVTAGNAGSHLKIGWDALTHEVITAVCTYQPHVVFILWGAKAQAYRSKIEESKDIGKNHTVLCAPHPSPLSAYHGFFGSKPFSQTNKALIAHGQSAIVW
jgi:uracil-DNA glycosylase